MKPYNNYISLGYFCSVALELERIGLRSASSPFDWCISNFEGVIDAIENHFEQILDYPLLSQSNTIHSHYYNEKYKIWFFHDFDPYRSLKKQLPAVQKKYNRRISRFYETIKKPTLFVRYISTETYSETGKSRELEYIERNYSKIIALLKSFNENNDIIFISNAGVTSSIIDIFTVEADENDLVARKPLDKNASLYKMLTTVEYPLRNHNLELLQEKERKNNSYIQKTYTRWKAYLKRRFLKEYIHERSISPTKV